MSREIRKELLQACSEYVEARTKGIENVIKNLAAALKLETKCSMGDKYETDRAMLHLEFEKVAGQAENYKLLQKTLRSIPYVGKNDVVSFGSVVKTTVANYFIAIPAGEIIVRGEKFYAVGASSPIAQNLKGNKAGKTIIFNGKEILLKEVF